ncbi:MAG: hypothetical protein Ct9H300mP4_10190 [Gammaproteobacteria bacterium]|nr:MAG: hypothetical protein Ct9H300mP4_10190 [Gammaproteobacteria bacterium]
MKANITIMSGDGVGPEITREAVKILQAIGSVFDHDFSLDDVLFGGIAMIRLERPTLKKHNRHVKTQMQSYLVLSADPSGAIPI